MSGWGWPLVCGGLEKRFLTLSGPCSWVLPFLSCSLDFTDPAVAVTLTIAGVGTGTSMCFHWVNLCARCRASWPGTQASHSPPFSGWGALQPLQPQSPHLWNGGTLASPPCWLVAHPLCLHTMYNAWSDVTQYISGVTVITTIIVLFPNNYKCHLGQPGAHITANRSSLWFGGS